MLITAEDEELVAAEVIVAPSRRGLKCNVDLTPGGGGAGSYRRPFAKGTEM